MGNTCNCNVQIIHIEYPIIQESIKPIREQEETQIYQKPEIIKEYQNTSNIEGSQGSDENLQRIGGRGRTVFIQQSNTHTYGRIRNSLSNSTSTQSYEYDNNYGYICHISDPCPKSADIKSYVERNINKSY